MSRCKCDWSDKYTADTFKRITPITRKEEEQIEAMFRTYLIVKIKDRRTKNVYCTRCRESSDFIKPHNAPKLDYDPYNDFTDYYGLKHGDKTHCPFCGEPTEIVYAGKMGMQCEKMWQQVKVVVFHAEAGGWLSAQAVYAIKNYRGKEWQTQAELWEKQRYLFHPGCALQQEWRWRCIGADWKLEWSETTTIYEPFKSGMERMWGYDGREYEEIGLDECLSRTDMKYSAVDIFFGPESNFGLMRYLGEYCHRPQLEMLVKLEMDDILRELIYCRRSNARLLNWRAKTLPEFLRLDKRHTKMFMKSKHRSMQELEVIQMLMREKRYALDITEYMAGLSIETIRQLHEAAENEPLTKVIRYLKKQGSDQAAQLWIDYIRMAKELKYDLTEETVFFPKDLRARHDTATASIELKRDKAKAKKLARRTKILKARYEFTDGEFAIVIPPSMASIIAEGKALHHCVGTYVNRHVDGQTTILFLRKTDDMDRPYGTIEMSVTDAASMIQLRGDHNNDIPRRESEQFIAAWLQWVKNKSPRDAQGNPITETDIEIRTRVRATA